MMRLDDNQQNLLNHIAAAILIVDDSGRIVFANRESENLLGSKNDPEPGLILQEQLFSIIDQIKTNVSGRMSFQLASSSSEQRMFQALYTNYTDNLYSITLRDISKEARLIHQYTFAQKELNAKNILQKHKDNTIRELKTILNQVYQYSPNDLVIINKNHSILESNLDFLIADSDKAGINKCYQIVNKESPCPNCPLQQKTLIDSQQKIGHTLSDQYVQETFSPFSNQKMFLLIFEDTTRKIDLIEKIREQHQTIQYQKDLFADLVDMILFMHQSDDMEKVVDGYLETIAMKTNAGAGAILIEGEQRNDLWIKSKLSISANSIDTILNEYLSQPTRTRTIKSLTYQGLSSPKHNWEIIPLINSEKVQIGDLILDIAMDDEKQQIITLYSEPLTAYLTNSLLTQKLKIIAHTDGLTGLYNRYYLMQCIKEEENRFEKLGCHYSLVLGDVNGLKPVNDTYGHEAGDELLRKISACLKTVCRKTDIIARLGGDEFCILLPDTNSAGTRRFLERMDEWCAGKYLEHAGKQLVPLSISLGFSCTDSSSVEHLMQVADERMFKAKEEYYKTHKRYR